MLELVERLKLQKKELEILDLKLNESFREYYRDVIRKEDREYIKKISKIPDSWDNYAQTSEIELNDITKHKLTDVKKKMSREIKMQSMYLASIISIENLFLDLLNNRELGRDEISEAVQSINYILLKLEDEIINIKHLILSLAKRSISDCYYLLGTYGKFYLNKVFVYETDFKDLLSRILVIFGNYPNVIDNVGRFIAYDNRISKLFDKKSNKLGWKLNESEAKSFFENDDSSFLAMDLYKVAIDTFKFKKNLKDNYLFLKYYYNENDGKEFRLNFINDSISNKFNDGKIEENVLTNYSKIIDSFKEYKQQFDILGLHGFGPEKFIYIEVLQFLYKICKLVEFYYLRNMQYDELKEFRDKILYYVENEIFSLS